MKINKLMQLLKDNARAEGTVPLRMEAGATQAHIYLYDVIDSYWGTSAASLINALATAGDLPVQLHINSPGGDVFEAIAMQSAIAAHPQPVHACVEGVCASAATGIALACKDVCMTDGSLFMVHNAWTMAYGDKGAFRATADLLDKVDAGIAATYMRRTGASAEQVAAWMDAETWFTAAEAVAAGFAQSVESASQQDKTPQDSTVRWDLSAYANAPIIAPPTVDLSAQAARQIQMNRNRLQLFQI